jgi:gas vesicle protein
MKSFFAGLGIGAALGILFAPRSGDEIQDDVRGEVWLVRQCVAQLVDGYPAWAGVFLSLAQTCNRPSSLVEAPSSTVLQTGQTSSQF